MNPKLNVLLAVPWDQETGGVATVAGNLARHLTANGHRVMFFHPANSERLRHKTTKWGFPGVELNLRVPFNRDHPVRSVIAFAVMFPWTLVQLIRLLREHRIGVVNIHYAGEQFVYFAVCRWLLPIRLVISVHGMDIMRWDAPATRQSRALAALFRAADLVVAPSTRFLRRCEHLLGRAIRRGVTIHNGTEISNLNIFADGGSCAPPFVLTVTSFDAWKGVDVLIRAMALLRDSGRVVPLVIAGDGPRRGDIEQLIRTHGLSDSVRLLGDQPRASVIDLLHQCMLFVLPSRFESFGIAVVEAMACGKAVIATRVDGVLEIIEDSKHGLLVEAGDPIALAEAIGTLTGDASLRARLGDAARERVTNRFLISRMGEAYTNAFEEVLACPRM
jgi:glycosyltransferase involved in cell wall biosynthesis